MDRTTFSEVLTFERFKPKCECPNPHFRHLMMLHPLPHCPGPGMTLCMVDHEPVFLCRVCVDQMKGELK